MSIKEFGFGSGDEDLDSKGKRFKAKEGERYRASFVWWPGLEEGTPNLSAESPKFIGCKRLYIQGVGYFVDKGLEYQKLAGGGAGKMYAATMIVVWPTDSQGNLDKARFTNGEFKLYSWTMSVDKYRTIEQNNREFPLGKHDMTLSCTDTKFQKITFSPCRESLFGKLVENGKAALILAAAKELATSMPGELAQDLTLEQIREKLARAGGASPVGPVVGGPGGVVGGGASGLSSNELDAMLGDIIK